MDNYTRFDMYQDLSTEKVNWDTMFTLDEEIGCIITIRARPYKTDRQTGRMVLAGGRTLDEAFAYAQLGLIQANYIPLDWSQRAVSVGIQGPSANNPLKTTRRVSADSLQAAINGGSMASAMGIAPDVPQNVPQKRQGQAKTG